MATEEGKRRETDKGEGNEQIRGRKGIKRQERKGDEETIDKRYA